MVSLLAAIGLGGSGLLYVVVAWRIHARSKRLHDQFPMSTSGGLAHVLNSSEFSAATVATTISLATVILAFAELAGTMGAWLLWPVVTTALGIALVRLAAPTIYRRMSEYGMHRPTLHQFLGSAYNSTILMQSAAACTSLGFLGAFAVELTVGAGFLAKLIPAIPSLVAVLVLAAIGVTYTALGGFRAVVITDRIQMWAIWAALVALTIALSWQIKLNGGQAFVIREMPPSVYDFSWRPGLAAFLVGIFVINVPTFLADMSIWQRIAGSVNIGVITTGLWRSVVSAILTWTFIVGIVCSLLVLPSSRQDESNAFYNFLFSLGNESSVGYSVLFLVVVVGLYAAGLSTASTQLIAASHTIHTDILRQGRDTQSLSEAAGELSISRRVLFFLAVVSVLVVAGLSNAGFSIVDLVFAVYGAQLGMVPVVIGGLYFNRNTRATLGRWASIAVIAGFATGWGTAAAGKIFGLTDTVFLSPVAALVVSSVIFLYGWLLVSRRASSLKC